MKIGFTFLALLLWAGTVSAQTTTPPKPTPHGSATPSQSAAQSDQAAQSEQTQSDQTKGPAAPEKVDPAKAAAIRHLMDLTNTSKLGDNVVSYFTGRVKSIMSQNLGQDRLPAFMDTFTKEFSAKVSSDTINAAVVPIYAHYFTTEDIDGLIKFYESPLGQRVVKLMPQVDRDTQNVSLDLGNKAALATLQSMTTDYPELKQMLQPGPGAGAGAGAGAAPENGPGEHTPPSPEPAPQAPTPEK
jgi:uncharacterized protein